MQRAPIKVDHHEQADASIAKQKPSVDDEIKNMRSEIFSRKTASIRKNSTLLRTATQKIKNSTKNIVASAA